MIPQRAYVSGPRMDHTRGVMVFEPRVGEPMQLFLDNGKVVRTSIVRTVTRDSGELVIDTLNSRYRVELEPASS
jgi:hypothetical protein